MASLANIWKKAEGAQTKSHLSLVAANTGEETIEAGDFRINVLSRLASVCGHQLRLSSAEFDVLLFLFSHKRRIVTSPTRLTTQSESGGLRQADFIPALLSLRKKLQGEAPGSHYIDTEAWLLVEFHAGSDSR
jgi:DNA-binding response OmpR family regulator